MGQESNPFGRRPPPTPQIQLEAVDDTPSDPRIAQPIILDPPSHPSLVDSDDEPTDPSLSLPALSLPAPSLPSAPTRVLAPPPSLPRKAPPPPAPRNPAPTPSAPTPPRKLDLGALAPLMRDPEITEIMVNDTRNIMIEKGGRMGSSGISFSRAEDLERLIRSVLELTGRPLSPEQPYVDVMLPDGSRANIIGPPLTLGGPCITIRKFPARSLTLDDLVGTQMLDRRMGVFLQACVAGRMNLLISGGTGSGKTTLLNALLAFIPQSERVITIEDTPELVLGHPNCVRLQTKPQMPSSPPIPARELVANALRMRPDRVIVGECRRGEAFDMLQAMNTGHDGSMTTIHSNSPRDALSRLETLCLMAGVDLPLLPLRKQIQSAIDLVLQIRRFRNGARKVIGIAELTGMEGETITMQDIFVLDSPTRAAATGGTLPENASFRPTGFVPTFLDRLRDHGIEVPQEIFA